MALHGKAHEARKTALRNLMSFGAESDNIRGRVFPSGFPGSALHKGRLNDLDRDDLNRSIVVYVVYSYQTPIAWVSDGGVVTNVFQRFSNSTTNHQSACRQYLAMNVQRVVGQV